MMTAGELGRMLGNHAACGHEAGWVVERRRTEHREAQRIEDVGAEPVVADRQRADRVAVVRAAEGEERRAARHAAVHPVLERDLERLLDRRRAVARIEEVWPVNRHHTCEGLGKLDDDAIAVAEHRGVRAALQLLFDRVVELRYVVTERRDPQRRDCVEVPVAVDCR